MQLRDRCHKARSAFLRALSALPAVVLLVASCTPADAARAGASEAGPADARTEGAAAETPDAGTLPPAGYAWVIFGADTVLAEVAATADERAEGLMYRDDVPDGTGMLFVFQDNQPRAFWMANTYVPLDIAYMNPSYRIVDIIAMEPLVTESYPSREPSMFALEVRQGWFEENGIAVGEQASIVFGVRGH